MPDTVVHKTFGHKAVGHKIEAVRRELLELEQGGELAGLLRRVLDATDNTMTITDPRLPDNPLIYVNKQFETLTGYAQDEVLGRNCRFLQGEDGEQPNIDVLRDAIRAGRNTRVELRNYRKDGTMFWNELYLTAIYNDAGEVIYFFGVQNDITKFKELTELERRRTTELTLAENRERHRLAQRLHDGLQQDLFALQFALKRLEQQVQAGTLEPGAFAEVAAQLKDAARTARNVTSDLDMPVLENGELVAALRWLASRAGERHNLKVELNTPKHLDVPHDALRVLLASLVRELLFNVVKHAATDRAWLTVTQTQGRLNIEVRDEGRGFDPADAHTDATGFGLTSVRERLHLFGGSLSIEGGKNKGTCVTITVPNSTLGAD